MNVFVCLVCLFAFLTSSSTTKLYSGWIPSLTSDNFMCCHTRDRAERPVSLSRSHYTDTDPTSKERVATAGMEPRTLRALPTELLRPPYMCLCIENNDNSFSIITLFVCLSCNYVCLSKFPILQLALPAISSPLSPTLQTSLLCFVSIAYY